MPEGLAEQKEKERRNKRKGRKLLTHQKILGSQGKIFTKERSPERDPSLKAVSS